MVKLLLQNSATYINKMDLNECSPISTALFKVNNIALAEFITKAGADLNIFYEGYNDITIFFICIFV